MGRYEDLMKMINPEITKEDEAQKANNPRNWLAGKVNPALDEYINPMLPDSFKLNVPEMTVADQKRYDRDLPENMAGAAMGSINAKPNFGKVIQQAEAAAPSLGKVIQKVDAPQPLGKVEVVPSMADRLSDISKEFAPKKQLKANEISEKVQEIYGSELAKRKAAMKKNLLSPEEYGSFKQEMTDKVRRGEY